MNSSIEISEDELPAIVSLQNKLFPKAKWWTEDNAKAQLFDLARCQGRNVVKVLEKKAFKGIAGWISEPKTNEFYGAPFFAECANASLILITELVKQARGAKARFVRVGSFPFEKEKNEALAASGFKVAFEFIQLEISLKFSELKDLINLKYVDADHIVPSKYRDLYNDSFKGVSNAPPLDEAKAQELWESPELDRRLSGVWANDQGDYIAFIVIHTDGYLDSIGVHSAFQKQGLGSSIYESIFSKAYSLGMKCLRVMIADNNEASLKLHQRYGFKELERRQVWQFDLP